MDWKPGDRLRHRFNSELGPGLVHAVEGRTVQVHFPDADTSLTFAADSDAILRLELSPGARAVLRPSGATVTVAGASGPGRVLLTDGREVDEADLWPVGAQVSLTERLAQGEVDSLERFSTRLESLYLNEIREAGGLGSFLGGRIRLFPHQLHVAESATRTDPVRWLLADEVGLGKTVEACLVLNRLVREHRAERTLVVAPETLTVQWLGELWRKYHQVFVLLDAERLNDVERDHGPGFNPFEVHRRVVIGLSFLRDRPWLTERAVEAGIDLLIVDEAHHLRRPPGHPGSLEYRAIAPIAALGRHVLLLTATPFEQDAHGFLRLLQLLRPENFPENVGLEQRLEYGDPLPPCASATRRADIGGLPPRVPRPIDLDADPGSAALSELETELRSRPATETLERREKARRIRRALSSGAALEALLGRGEDALRDLARAADAEDPRIAWLAREAPAWRRDGDKTLIFVAHRETLEAIRTALSHRAQIRTGVFHEDLSPAQRDIEVAQFRLPSGPGVLVSTECGGEGRNFEFCTRLVLFDLPWGPMTVEQRIGRLDRIGRRLPVEIVYFRPPAGVGRLVAETFDSLGLFERPLGGLEHELGGVEQAIEEAVLAEGSVGPALAGSTLGGAIAHAGSVRERIRRAARSELLRDLYRAELAGSILARVPKDLEEITREVVLGLAAELHFRVEEHHEGARHSIEIGNASRVSGLPGVPGGSSFLGTFDREEAVQDESIDFFASGHPLVEGLLAHLEESPDGRVGLLHVRVPGESGMGLVAIYRRGAGFEAVAIDLDGRERPEWAARLVRRPLKSRRVSPESWTRQPGWPEWVRGMARHFEGRGTMVALAAFRIEP